MELKAILIYALIAFAVYAILRLFAKPKDTIGKEIEEVLNSDKYKVKSKFE
jgi:hypothetical protein